MLQFINNRRHRCVTNASLSKLIRELNGHPTSKQPNASTVKTEAGLKRYGRPFDVVQQIVTLIDTERKLTIFSGRALLSHPSRVACPSACTPACFYRSEWRLNGGLKHARQKPVTENGLSFCL